MGSLELLNAILELYNENKTDGFLSIFRTCNLLLLKTISRHAKAVAGKVKRDSQGTRKHRCCP